VAANVRPQGAVVKDVRKSPQVSFRED